MFRKKVDTFSQSQYIDRSIIMKEIAKLSNKQKRNSLLSITDGMRSGWRTLLDSMLSSTTSAPTHQEEPCQEQHGSGLTVGFGFICPSMGPT